MAQKNSPEGPKLPRMTQNGPACPKWHLDNSDWNVPKVKEAIRFTLYKSVYVSIFGCYLKKRAGKLESQVIR